MRLRVPLFMLCAWTLLGQDGAAIYQARCAGCHDAPGARVPSLHALRAMNAALILRAIEGGVMKTQVEGLTTQERHAVLIYLATPELKPATLPSSAFCTAKAKFPTVMQGPSWTGWSPDDANTRFQEAAGFTAADVSKLKLKWAFGLGDGINARSQPAVAGGRVFVGSQSGTVYSLDARTGCINWTFEAAAGVRSGVVVGPLKHPAVFLTDERANVYAVDASTGKERWKAHVEDHFAARGTATPLLHGGVLYVPVASIEEGLAPSPTYECCTFRGSVVALAADTGKLIWKSYTIADAAQPTKKSKMGAQMYGPSGAGVWSAPTFDEKRDALYVATSDNYSDPATITSDAVIALDRKTGKMLWSRQLTSGDVFNLGPESHGPDFDFGQSPILVSLANGKRALVIGQKSGVAYGLDPDQQGAMLWQTRVGKGGTLGGSQWGSAADRQNLYVAVSDVKLGVVPDKTSPQGYALKPDSQQGGGLFALRLATGETAWSAKPPSCGDRKNCSPAQSAAVTAIPGVVFSGSVDGHLRAYQAATGEAIWDVDTVREYETVNGQKAHGGSLDGPGPVIAGGVLYVNSGYGRWGGLPGNVLLAFSVDGQ